MRPTFDPLTPPYPPPLHAAADADQDAARIIAFTLRHGVPPVLTPHATAAARLARAIARATLAIRRREDEHAPTVERIAEALRALAAVHRTIERADLTAHAHADAPPPVATRSTPPHGAGGDKDRRPTPPRTDPQGPPPAAYADLRAF